MKKVTIWSNDSGKRLIEGYVVNESNSFIAVVENKTDHPALAEWFPLSNKHFTVSLE